VSRRLSALGEMVRPVGTEPPSSPRMASTLSGLPGNGLVASSFASTSTVVVCPRGARTESGAGRASGRLDATMFRAIWPCSPVVILSRTPSTMAVEAPLTAASFARSTSLWPVSV